MKTKALSHRNENDLSIWPRLRSYRGLISYFLERCCLLILLVYVMGSQSEFRLIIRELREDMNEKNCTSF